MRWPFPTFVKTLIQIPQLHRSGLPRNRRDHHFRRRPRHRHRHHPLSLGAACFSSSSDAVSRVVASPLFAPRPLFLSIPISVSHRAQISRIARSLSRSIESRYERACPFGVFVRGIRANRFLPVRSHVSRILPYSSERSQIASQSHGCHSTLRSTEDDTSARFVRTKFRVLRVEEGPLDACVSRSTVVRFFASVTSVACVGENVYRIKLRQRVFRGSRPILFRFVVTLFTLVFCQLTFSHNSVLSLFACRNTVFFPIDRI